MKNGIDNIKPYAKNAKLHNKKQIEQVAASIREFGFNQPIVVDKNGVIIVGHARYEAAKLLELKEVPTITVDLSEEKAKAYRLADNKLNESDWDMGLALDDLKGLSEELFNLTGFDKDLLVEPDDKDDIVPDNAPTRAKLGDIWALGRHRVMCGDSTDKASVERLVGGKKADMVYNDPPYGMLLDADFSGMKGIGRGNKYRNVIGDHADFTNDFILKPLKWFNYCKEIFMWGADYYAEIIPNKNEGSWIVWDKMQGGEGVNDKYDKMFGSNFELCWSKKKHKRAIARVLWKGIFGLSKEPGKKRVHPTQKPVELSVWFLKNFSGEESVIADLFLGSGSTLIAAEKTNRICYGMELDPKYVDVIIQRYEDYVGGGAKAVKVI